MADNGVKSTDLANASLLDEVLGNRNGSTVAATMFTLAQQLLGSGPLADAIALDGQTHWRNTLANLNTVTGQTGDNGFVVNDGANNGVYRWSGSTWAKVSVLPGALGFKNLDDTSDANKPVSVAQAAAVAGNVSKLSMPQVDLANVGYITLSGSFVADNTWRHSDYIPTRSLKIVGLSVKGNANALSVAWYDESKVFISGIASAARVTDPGIMPATAKFVRFTDFNDAASIAARVLAIATAAYPDAFVLASGASPVELITAAAWSVGYISYPAGQIITDTNFQYSQLMYLAEGTSLKYNLLNQTQVSSIACYNANGIYIGGLSGAASTATPESGTFILLAGTKSIRLSKPNPAGNIPVAVKFIPSINIGLNVVKEVISSTSEPVPIRDNACRKIMRKPVLFPASKILLYGDSRFSTDYTFAKDAFEAVTGASVYNGGFSGQTVAATALDDRLQRIWDYMPDVIVFLPGGNDTGASGTVGSFDGSVYNEPVVAQTDIAVNYAGSKFIQAVDHTVRKIQAYYYNIRVRAALSGLETEAEKTAKIDALVKPYIILCTDVPQQRTDGSNAFSVAANWTRKRDAIAEVGQKNNVHTVDTMTDLAVNMALEPYYVGPTDKLTNTGIYTMDGLHPNKWGHRRIAEIVCGDSGIV